VQDRSGLIVVKKRNPMKYRLIFFSVLMMATTGMAEAQVRFDTLSTRPIGPGMIHTHIVEYTQPWNINVIEIDLTNPYVQMRAMLASDRVGGYETVGSMARRHDREGHRVVAAINGGFFTTSWPVATHIQDGEMAIEPVTRGERPSIGFSSENRAAIEMPFFSGTLTLPDTALVINGVNRTRGDGELIVYNRFMGSATGTTSTGSEIVVRAIDEWAVNAPVRVVVDNVRTNAGGTPIPARGAVLSGHGERGVFLAANLAAGDTLTLRLGAKPGVDDLREMITGGPFIVRNGQVNVGPRGDGVDRHPRTAAAINADSTRFYMVTVDGRQAASAGMTLQELGEWMVSVGMDRAMNLDGGGSTTLIVHGDVQNLLTGDQRAVANGLAVVSLAPFGELAAVRARQRSLRIFRGQSFTFDVYGVDEYSHPAAFDPGLVAFSVDEGLGQVDGAGVFTAALHAAEGNLYIIYGELVDTVSVVVTDIETLRVRPAELVIDTTRTFSFTYQVFDSFGLRQSISAADVSWSVTDETIGTIDEAGRFRGLQAGVTSVVARYRELTDTARVEVQIADGVAMLDPLDSLDGWEIVLENVDEAGSRASIVELDDGTSAVQLDYRFVQGSATVFRIYLRNELEIYGLPEYVHVDVQSDGLNHRVFFQLEDATGHRHRAPVPKWINVTTFDSLAARATWSSMVPPLRLTGIEVQFGNTGVAGAVNEGAVLLRNLRVSYPVRSAVSIDDETAVLPARIALEQNYPNPFNPTTRIAYRLDAAGQTSLRVFDVLGRQVAVLVDSVLPAGEFEAVFDATTLASGTYLYVLEHEGQRVSQVMTLLK
jgi:hypothetical protein